MRKSSKTMCSMFDIIRRVVRSTFSTQPAPDAAGIETNLTAGQVESARNTPFSISSPVKKTLHQVRENHGAKVQHGKNVLCCHLRLHVRAPVNTVADQIDEFEKTHGNINTIIRHCEMNPPSRRHRQQQQVILLGFTWPQRLAITRSSRIQPKKWEAMLHTTRKRWLNSFLIAHCRWSSSD